MVTVSLRELIEFVGFLVIFLASAGLIFWLFVKFIATPERTNCDY